eukprot:TRINITY_DN68202_c0_g1_i1.p1 TRINITY_DN68202_c0_g1~~TRINITY_DN68202_c0_g1_i1.p1  ORF type:complete len:651 (+),score=79.83 TRINITY_DN68202_c0_g1_i1:124-2076(+)
MSRTRLNSRQVTDAATEGGDSEGCDTNRLNASASGSKVNTRQDGGPRVHDVQDEMKDFLRLARPEWLKTRNGRVILDCVLEKLTAVGVFSIHELLRRLDGSTLNMDLCEAGYKGFSPETLECLRKGKSFQCIVESLTEPYYRNIGLFAPTPQLLAKTNLWHRANRQADIRSTSATKAQKAVRDTCIPDKAMRPVTCSGGTVGSSDVVKPGPTPDPVSMPASKSSSKTKALRRRQSCGGGGVAAYEAVVSRANSCAGEGRCSRRGCGHGRKNGAPGTGDGGGSSRPSLRFAKSASESQTKSLSGEGRHDALRHGDSGKGNGDGLAPKPLPKSAPSTGRVFVIRRGGAARADPCLPVEIKEDPISLTPAEQRTPSLQSAQGATGDEATSIACALQTDTRGPAATLAVPGEQAPRRRPRSSEGLFNRTGLRGDAVDHRLRRQSSAAALQSTSDAFAGADGGSGSIIVDEAHSKRPPSSPSNRRTIRSLSFSRPTDSAELETCDSTLESDAEQMRRAGAEMLEGKRWAQWSSLRAETLVEHGEAVLREQQALEEKRDLFASMVREGTGSATRQKITNNIRTRLRKERDRDAKVAMDMHNQCTSIRNHIQSMQNARRELGTVRKQAQRLIESDSGVRGFNAGQFALWVQPEASHG